LVDRGDVIVEGDDIHGNGVNIADRLQALARPGGVVISGTAYDQVTTTSTWATSSWANRR
jgi:adenylate cyclase